MATATPDVRTASPPTAATEPDGLYEVIGTQIVETPPMGAYEVELASLLQEWLGPFARTNRLGRAVVEMLFDLRPAVDRDRRPDLAFVSAERWPLERRAPKSASWPVVPDLAVEIVSPTNSADEIVTKLGEYFRAGVRLVWVVYPTEEQVQVWDSPDGCRVLRVGSELDGGAVLPGFRLPVAALFVEEQTNP